MENVRWNQIVHLMAAKKNEKEEVEEVSTVKKKSITYIELGNSCNPSHRNICLLEGFTGIVLKN